MLYAVKLMTGIKKGIRKIDVNKIKNVDAFIHQLKIIINNKIMLLKHLL